MKTAEMYYITVNVMIKLSFLRQGAFQSQIFLHHKKIAALFTLKYILGQLHDIMKPYMQEKTCDLSPSYRQCSLETFTGVRYKLQCVQTSNFISSYLLV